MKLLTSALVQRHFDYACSSYYSSFFEKTKSKLQVCKNKPITSVLELTAHTHLEYSHFIELNWLQGEKRIVHLSINHVHHTVNGNAPY